MRLPKPARAGICASSAPPLTSVPMARTLPGRKACSGISSDETCKRTARFPDMKQELLPATCRASLDQVCEATTASWEAIRTAEKSSHEAANKLQ